MRKNSASIFRILYVGIFRIPQFRILTLPGQLTETNYHATVIFVTASPKAPNGDWRSALRWNWGCGGGESSYRIGLSQTHHVP